jgi:NAD(P)-dependent dehydrogenase (short-subunit alcohol dehydrogenase family)
MKSYKDKVAVVTGAAGGIGQALVLELANRGAHIALCDIADMTNTLDLLKKYNVKVYSEKVDMSSKEAINTFVDNVLSYHKQVDILINNAGIPLGDRTFDEVTEKDFERITNINYWGVIHTTMRLYPHMVKRPDAAIANLSSSQGILPLPYLVPYCTTKFAVRGFTDTLRVENQVRGIKNVSVHTIHPGAVATNITINADYLGGNTDLFHKQLQNKGTKPAEAAKIILNGIQKGKVRIFISDGRYHDILMRIIPSNVGGVLRFFMKLLKIKIR